MCLSNVRLRRKRKKKRVSKLKKYRVTMMKILLLKKKKKSKIIMKMMIINLIKNVNRKVSCLTEYILPKILVKEQHKKFLMKHSKS